MNIRKICCTSISYCLTVACAGFIIIPIMMLVTGSFMGKEEVTACIAPALGFVEGETKWHLIPQYPTLRPYVALLLDTPEYFVMFWNSCREVFAILAGQLFVAVPAAWALGTIPFRGRRLLYWLYIILIILPFQVMMVSYYLVLDSMKLLDTHMAVVLPAVFSTFPVFIMTSFFRSIPIELLEAAKLDGAGELGLFIKIGLPLGKAGISAVTVLTMLEYWNAIEAPMIFLSDQMKYPLSLYLPSITLENMGVAFAASLVTLVPALLVFLYGKDDLESGIQASGIKG